HSFFRRLLKSAARLHFAKEAFPLHLLLQNPKSLIDIVVSYKNLQDISFQKSAETASMIRLFTDPDAGSFEPRLFVAFRTSRSRRRPRCCAFLFLDIARKDAAFELLVAKVDPILDLSVV